MYMHLRQTYSKAKQLILHRLRINQVLFSSLLGDGFSFSHPSPVTPLLLPPLCSLIFPLASPSLLPPLLSSLLFLRPLSSRQTYQPIDTTTDRHTNRYA